MLIESFGGNRSEAHSIDNLGNIVGIAQTARGASAFIFHSGTGTLLDLNNLTDTSIELNEGLRINDAGQILVREEERRKTVYVVLSPIE